MTHKRFWFSVLAVWLVMFVTDFLFHGIWLATLYQQTAQYWRSPEEMQHYMPFMWIGQAIFAFSFVWIYSKGISKDNQWSQAFRFAMAILFVSKVPTQLGLWATSPYPIELVLRWFFIASVQAIACAFVMTWTFKPSTWTMAHANH